MCSGICGGSLFSISLDFRVEYAHGEARELFGTDPRNYFVAPEEFISDEKGNVKGVQVVRMRWKRVAGVYHMVKDEYEQSRMVKCAY